MVHIKLVLQADQLLQQAKVQINDMVNTNMTYDVVSLVVQRNLTISRLKVWLIVNLIQQEK